jgi:hypothetical protein
VGGDERWKRVDNDSLCVCFTPGAYTEKRRADSFKFLFVLIKIDIKMMKNGI